MKDSLQYTEFVVRSSLEACQLYRRLYIFNSFVPTLTRKFFKQIRTCNQNTVFFMETPKLGSVGAPPLRWED